MRRVPAERMAWTGLGVAGAILGLARPAAAQFMDKQITAFVLADQLEYSRIGSGRPLEWDLAGWVGTGYTRLWFKTEGEWATVGGGRQFDVRAEYSRLITPFWELQGGVRMEVSRRGNRTDTRAHLDLGLLGLAPYWLQLEPELFIAQDGQVSMRLTVEYDQLLTQRLVVQPRFETYAAFSENQTFRIGSGLNYIEPGLRLRYEIRREIGPYIGVIWRRRLGGTAGLARADGESAGHLALLVGLRVWR